MAQQAAVAIGAGSLLAELLGQEITEEDSHTSLFEMSGEEGDGSDDDQEDEIDLDEDELLFLEVTQDDPELAAALPWLQSGFNSVAQRNEESIQQPINEDAESTKPETVAPPPPLTSEEIAEIHQIRPGHTNHHGEALPTKRVSPELLNSPSPHLLNSSIFIFLSQMKVPRFY